MLVASASILTPVLAAAPSTGDFSLQALVHHVPLLMSSISALMGLVMLGLGLLAYRRAKASTGWPMTEGKITRSEVVSGSEGTTRPEITYEYVVNGQPHRGDRLKAAHKNYGTNGRQAQTNVERYPVGGRVQVFYNPAKPEQSALEPGLSPGAYVSLGIGLVLLISAVVQYFVMTRFMHFD